MRKDPSGMNFNKKGHFKTTFKYKSACKEYITDMEFRNDDDDMTMKNVIILALQKFSCFFLN